ncbi:MAG: SpoIID/LytB domain-containing protein [Bryobacteraceae bacterium]
MTLLLLQVFSLFSITDLQVEAPSVRLAGQMAPEVSKVTAKGGQVCAGAVCGATLRTHGGVVRLAIRGKIERSYPGDVEITARDGKLIAVVRLEVENAVAAVVAAEMPEGAAQAQYAQAVAARSYYLAQKGRHAGADFCDSTHCQFLTVANAASREAALRTRGQVLRHRGEPVVAMYFRSCGGRTKRAEDVQLPGVAYPYAAVECRVCAREPYTWESEVPAALFRSGGAEALRLELTRRFGWNRMPSNDYTAEARGETVVLHGKGQGHGVGMCQRGAMGMAAAGEDYKRILAHYFPGARIGD